MAYRVDDRGDLVMSKYIKLEDAEKLLTNALRIAQGFDEPLERSLVDLPTIEVSDEQLSKLQSSENSVENTTASEDFTSISRANSKLEVSEDAISKAYLEQEIENQIMIVNDEHWRGWNNALDKVVELIENAPSVLPKPKEGEWELSSDDDGEYGICSICGNDADFTQMTQISRKREEFIANTYQCSECGNKTNDRHGLPAICPWCGTESKAEKLLPKNRK